MTKQELWIGVWTRHHNIETRAEELHSRISELFPCKTVVKVFDATDETAAEGFTFHVAIVDSSLDMTKRLKNRSISPSLIQNGLLLRLGE